MEFSAGNVEKGEDLEWKSSVVFGMKKGVLSCDRNISLEGKLELGSWRCKIQGSTAVTVSYSLCNRYN